MSDATIYFKMALVGMFIGISGVFLLLLTPIILHYTRPELTERQAGMYGLWETVVILCDIVLMIICFEIDRRKNEAYK